MLRNRKPPSAAKAATAMRVAEENGTDAEETQVDQWFLAPRLVSTRSPPAAARDAEGADDQRRAPPPAGTSMMPKVSEEQEHDHQHLPDRSSRRARGARGLGDEAQRQHDGGEPTGMLIQKMERQPTDADQQAADHGAEGHARRRRPRPRRRRPGRARAASVKVLVMIDIATGFSMEPPTAWSIRKTTSQPSPGAMLHSSEPAEKTHQADDEGSLPPEAVGRRARRA